MKFKVLFPNELLSQRRTGELFGYAHPTTGTFHVVSCGQMPSHSGSRPMQSLGELTNSPSAKVPISGRRLVGYLLDSQEIDFWYQDTQCEVDYYSIVQDVFSRNTGILEYSELLDKRVIVCGCGSVGSYAALELARSGVGHFFLVDNDIVAHHNLCRHQCGYADVGRLKVDALRDRILDINPTAEVSVSPSMIHQVRKQDLDEWGGSESLILGAADNRESDSYANRLSQVYDMPLLSIGLWERAFAGEIFWSIPGETPCYMCMMRADDGQISGRHSTGRRLYTTDPNSTDNIFEPGLSVDIGFVTNIGVKLALDLLSRKKRASRLLFSLKQFTLICNTTRVKVPGDLQELFDHPLQITRSIEVDFYQGCPHCSPGDTPRSQFAAHADK